MYKKIIKALLLFCKSIIEKKIPENFKVYKRNYHNFKLVFSQKYKY